MLAIARSHGIQPEQIQNWRQNRDKILLTYEKKKHIARSWPSSIGHLEEQVIGWGLGMRSKGVKISYKSLQVKACQIDEGFRNLPRQLQYHQIRRLAISNCLVERRITHQSQKFHQEALDEALEWLLEVRPILHGPTIRKSYIRLQQGISQLSACTSPLQEHTHHQIDMHLQ